MNKKEDHIPNLENDVSTDMENEISLAYNEWTIWDKVGGFHKWFEKKNDSSENLMCPWDTTRKRLSNFVIYIYISIKKLN